MKFLAIICARGGSKGLKNKNLKIIGNHPLIGHAINMAKSIKQIDKIIVSTDSLKIARCAKKYGAEVPFLRPKKISTDRSKEIDAWKHALKFYQKQNIFFDAIISLPCTSPLRAKVDIINCIKKYQTNKFEAIITIKKSHRNPYFNMVKKKDNRFEIVNKGKKYLHNRQDAPETFDVCTLCYIAKTKFIKHAKNIFQGNVGAVLVPEKRSIDIDNKLDYELAKNIYEKKIKL
jgi:CMP-N-acetylneuraminic acid synthetase|tara:strand:- start:2400 stop:3095 length:696 start_codon:yes stop_codon:yes gene_type:complete